MPSLPDSESGRRLLLAAGTARFEQLCDSDLSHVPAELERIEATFAELGYTRQQSEANFNPESSQLRALFEDVKEASLADDFVVAYYTGHGARDLERFYLLTRDSSLSKLDRTALPAEDLARALTKDSKASQVLLILDACYAGAGAAEFAQIASRLTAILGAGPAVFVVAAARPKQEAEEGALSSALAEALANYDGKLGGHAQAFLAMDDVMQSVDDYLSEKHPAQTATWSSANVRGRSRLFPNPRFCPELRPGLDLETQRAFKEHWVPKARGAELGAGGWYFTGRDRVLRELSAWLSAEYSDGRARIVTGGAGCGKSAVLARVVTLADPTYRKEVLTATRSVTIDQTTLPPEGVVSVAFHARRKLLEETIEQIATGLGLATRDPADLLDAIARLSEKTVIVVDALDEADEAEQIVSLLHPLAALPQVFLLVGTRPDSPDRQQRFRALGESTVEIDLDAPHYIGIDDMARYVERRLLAAEEPNRPTPYRDSPQIALTVAHAVAKRANNVFLVARTAVQALLAEGSTVDITQPGWFERLPAGLEDAFSKVLSDLDARRPDGLSATKARAVLLALAFAEGEGLPWVDLWAAVATALSTADVVDADIGLVLKHAAAFIVEAVEQDRSVYRLYHETLAALLRDSLPDAKRAQQSIVGVLRSRVVRTPTENMPDWPRAHPYLLTHLPAHAHKASLLGELAADGLFIAATDPSHTLEALVSDTDPLARRAFACYSLAFDSLLDEPPEIRQSYLEMMARQLADNGLAEIWGRNDLPRRWKVHWARWAPMTSHRRIRMESRVTSVAVGTLGGRSVIVSGCANGTLRVWDLATATPRGQLLRGHNDQVLSVAVGTLDGRSVMVSGDSVGMLRVWDLATGTPHGQPMRRHNGEEVRSVAVGTVDGRPVIVSSGGTDGTLRIRDLATGTRRGQPLRGHNGRVLSIGLGTLDGRSVVVSAGSDGTLRVWDLATGTPRGQPLYGHGSWINSVAVGTVDGRSVIVSGDSASMLRVWDLTTGTPRGQPLHGHIGWIKSVALGTLDGRSVIVSADSDGTLRVWDLATGTPRGQPLRGHDGWINSVAVGMLGGRSVIVSGGSDRTLRVWDLATATPRGQLPRGHIGRVLSVAVGTLDGRSVIVTAGSDDTLRMWDFATGKPRGKWLYGHGSQWLYGHGSWINSVAVGMLDGRSVVVSAGGDGTLRMRDLATGRRRGQPLRGHNGRVLSVAVGTLDGRSVIVSGGSDGTLRVWDLAMGTPRGQPLRGHDGQVFSVALGTVDGRSVIVSGDSVGMLRVWDLATGTPHGQPLRGHGRVISLAVGTLDGRSVIVSASSDRTLRVWDLATGTPRVQRLYGHGSWINSVAVATLDGRSVVVSAGSDGTLRVWDSKGVMVFSVRTGSAINDLAFVPPGIFAVATNQGLLLLQFESKAAMDSASQWV